MASITYDGQSFMLDGRRAWIVSGTMHYPRIPRELWATRIHQAKLAGLNTVEVPVVWSLHEPRAGQFDFEGAQDLRAFIELLGEAGLYCILRAGPFVGDGLDSGGIPAWLGATPDVGLRSNTPAFLEASSRFITALAGQVKDLQVTSAGAGGPILLLQSECNWTCGDETVGQAYLGELHRYFREAGFTVPTINANDLYQSAGEIDCWRGFDGVLANLRQLGQVRPDNPRLLIEFPMGERRIWGDADRTDRAAPEVFRRLTEILAAGAQYNLAPFHGGTNFGFLAGQEGDAPHGHFTTANERGAPLGETGEATERYHVTRFVNTFASTFARVLANIDPKRQTVTLPPPVPGAAKGTPNFGLVHAMGTQGEIVFIFGDEMGKARNQTVPLLLPNGTSLEVELGSLPVVWVLFDTRISGKAWLDWSTLPVLGVTGDVLVCFGPGGGRGSLSINGSPLEVEIPRGKTPEIVEHEEIRVVIASVEQAEGIYVLPDAVYVGVETVHPDGTATPLSGARQYKKITPDGEVHTERVSTPKSASSERLSLTNWKRAPLAGHTDGSSARYASIEGPASLTDLGAPHGYGWYRVQMKAPESGKVTFALPHARHRVQMILDGSPVGVLGTGPGTKQHASLSLKKGPHTLVMLAETLGRFANGQELGEPTGIFGHAFLLSPYKVAKPKITVERPIEPLSVRSPLWGVHPGDATSPERVTWTFTHRKKSPIIVELSEMPEAGIIVLNDEPIRYFEPGPATEPLVLDQETLNRGKNTLSIALLGDTKAQTAAITKAAIFHEGTTHITEGAEWAFAKWERPAKSAFKAVSKGDSDKSRTPAWWSAQFKAPSSGGVMVDLSGMTKGQLYVNGEHVCRYFVATDAGKAVPPQSKYYIPGPWLNEDVNELALFDESGGTPSKIKLARVEDGWTPEA